MPKKKDDIDEEFIIASIRSNSILSEKVENTQNMIQDEEKEVKRPKRKNDYETLFLKEVDLLSRNSKQTFVRKEHYDRIAKILQVVESDNKLSVFGYIDNVLKHHFTTFKDEITRVYNENHKDLF